MFLVYFLESNYSKLNSFSLIEEYNKSPPKRFKEKLVFFFQKHIYLKQIFLMYLGFKNNIFFKHYH